MLLKSLALGWCFTAAAVAAPPERPNIVLILADDLGAMDVGFDNPQTFYRTPHLDQLAAQGVRFTAGYAACPVCSPSRYAIQTGRYPTRSGITNYLPANPDQRFRGGELTLEMAKGETTVGEMLQRSGYATAFVGKWHLGANPDGWPEHRGYGVNVAGWAMGRPTSYFSPYKNPRLPDGPPREYLPERLAGEATKLIERYHREGRPFFLCYCDYLVHTPLQARAELTATYRQKALAAGLDPAGRFAPETQYWLHAQNGGPPGERRVRVVQSHPVYAAMVEGLDRAAGRILTKLDELGLAQNTLVIFTSDNGGLSTSEGWPTSNEPLRDGKGWLYEGGIREPFVVRWPARLPAGVTRSEPVISMDVFSTILQAAQVAAPPGVTVDGRSVLPAAEGAAMPERSLYWHYPHYGNQGGFPGAAVRRGTLKLIEDLENGRTWLYDLASDPSERHDLARERPRDAARLAADLAGWQRATGAKFLRQIPGGPRPWQPAWVSAQAQTAAPVAAAGSLPLEPWQRTVADE